MSSEYSTINRAEDAVAFADSRFGHHYIARLHAAKKRFLDLAMNVDLTDSYRAHAATRAATVQAELDYFDNSRLVLTDPSLLETLTAKLTGRERQKPIV